MRLDLPLAATIEERMRTTEAKRAALVALRKRIRVALDIAIRQENELHTREALERLQDVEGRLMALGHRNDSAGVIVPPVPPAAGSGSPSSTTPASTSRGKLEEKMDTEVKPVETKRVGFGECPRCGHVTYPGNTQREGLCGYCQRELGPHQASSVRYRKWLEAGKPRDTVRCTKCGVGRVEKAGDVCRGCRVTPARLAAMAKARESRWPKNGQVRAGVTQPVVRAVPPSAKASVDRLRALVRLGEEARRELARRMREARARVRDAEAALRALRR